MSRRHAIALVVLLLAGTAGCAQGQEYAVPGDVCGVGVQPALLKPLLPPGGSFSQSKTHEGGGAHQEYEDLLATASSVQETYVEWRRVLANGLTPVQEAALPRYERTRHFRIYEPGVIPGLLQTPAYAEAVDRLTPGPSRSSGTFPKPSPRRGGFGTLTCSRKAMGA
ncbi:Scr1 family TA system antitoxin-like transcriptional regulator [Streptomyces goshikiensis]|uniref:Scr1 family TA system antitoxin-like transcriptional regulator n=1 Tax=Streptomyces goshikiensis TaxID=1942 RepID=UPI00331D26C2